MKEFLYNHREEPRNQFARQLARRESARFQGQAVRKFMDRRPAKDANRQHPLGLGFLALDFVFFFPLSIFIISIES